MEKNGLVKIIIHPLEYHDFKFFSTLSEDLSLLSDFSFLPLHPDASGRKIEVEEEKSGSFSRLKYSLRDYDSRDTSYRFSIFYPYDLKKHRKN